MCADSFFTLSSSVVLKSNGKIKALASNRLYRFNNKNTWANVFDDVLDPEEFCMGKTDQVFVTVSDKSGIEVYEPDMRETIKVVQEFDNKLKYVTFTVNRYNSTDEEENNNVQSQGQEARKNVFDVMMGGARQINKSPVKFDEKSPHFTAKDALFNKVCDLLDGCEAKFPATFSNDDVKQHTMILANALWYLNGHFNGVQERASHMPNIIPIPARFMEFEGFNDYKKKKQKCPNVKSQVLKQHSQTLLQLASKQFCTTWGELHNDIEILATTFSSYSTFLDNSNLLQQGRQHKMTPSRQIEKDIWLDRRQGTKEEIKIEYQSLNNRINEAANFAPIFFDEEIFLTKPFDNSMDRFRYFQKLLLSNEVAICRYDPGGSNTTITYLWKLPENVTDKELMTSSTRIVQNLKQNLYEFHTRQMRKDFIQKFTNLGGVKIPPHIMRAIYAELTLDASADQNPEIDQRARMAILGEDPDLIIDMRHLNKGRPDDTFTVFFEHLEKEVQSVIAADERRHNVEHIAHYISVPDLIKQVKKNIPDDVPIPSEATVLFSFIPKNTHNNVSRLYKSKVPLRMSIQTRQLRAPHMDDHFAAAMFKYMREYAVQFRDDTTFVCLDDKSKLDFGEPSVAISSGVRGKKAIVPLNSVLSCLDHDCRSKGSLTPSVCLDVDVPEQTDESFYRGQVSVSLKDSVFQASNPFRHAVELENILNMKADKKPVLMLFTDGGPDHKVTFHSVKLALIILFKRLDLELLVAGRTAPGHSWTNPAERIMSLLNLAFQNAALSRIECTSDLEQVLRTCGGMADIRKKSETVAELKTSWVASLQPMITMLEERVQRVELKGKPVTVFKPASDDQISVFEHEVQQIDPNIVIGQYQQQQLKKADRYKRYLEKHCIERQYCFQIKRCSDPECCVAATIERPWLPDPVYSDQNGGHYKKFQDVIGTETTEKDRPSAQKQTVAAVAEEQQGCKNSFLVAQYVRSTVDCTDCSKPRCIYSKLKLTPRELRSLKILLTTHDYSCGSVITTDVTPKCDRCGYSLQGTKIHHQCNILDPVDLNAWSHQRSGHILQGKVFVKLQLICQSPIEFPYYSSGIGKPDICCYCCTPGIQQDKDLKKQFRVVLPVCQPCLDNQKPVLKRNPINK